VSQHAAATTPETAAWSTQAVDAEVAIDYWRSVRSKAYVEVAPYAARIRGADDLPVLLQRQRALAYMRHHLGDPDLDVDRIAVGCHVSRRTLYRLFEGTGQAVTAHLRTMRVDAAQRLLANQA
jgi:transcriptional regulator GlxA family with amidase domain